MFTLPFVPTLLLIHTHTMCAYPLHSHFPLRHSPLSHSTPSTHSLTAFIPLALPLTFLLFTRSPNVPLVCLPPLTSSPHPNFQTDENLKNILQLNLITMVPGLKVQDVEVSKFNLAQSIHQRLWVCGSEGGSKRVKEGGSEGRSKGVKEGWRKWRGE